MREMKDSGIEWIGEIPKEWNIIPTKYCFTVNNGSDPTTMMDIHPYTAVVRKVSRLALSLKRGRQFCLEEKELLIFRNGLKEDIGMLILHLM